MVFPIWELDQFCTHCLQLRCIPLFELFLRPNEKNLSTDQEREKAADKFYDRLLYLVVPLHFSCLAAFLYTIWSHPEAEGLTYWGWVSSMGILNGVFGINVAHELGIDQAKRNSFSLNSFYSAASICISSLNTTEGIIVMWPRGKTRRRPEMGAGVSILAALDHWFLAAGMGTEFNRLNRKKIGKWSVQNQMVRFSAIQLLFCLGIFWVGGKAVGVAFLFSAGFGILLLETVNYIEHYGLIRSHISERRYEKVMPWHSWNSNHRVGRWMLFELSRHSDHHHRPARKYHLLEHYPHSRQLPTGYPGMMLISLLPPLFFGLIHPRLNAPVHS